MFLIILLVSGSTVGEFTCKMATLALLTDYNWNWKIKNVLILREGNK